MFHKFLVKTVGHKKQKKCFIKKDLSTVCGFEAPCLIHILNSCFFTMAFPPWLFQDVGMKMGAPTCTSQAQCAKNYRYVQLVEILTN